MDAGSVLIALYHPKGGKMQLRRWACAWLFLSCSFMGMAKDYYAKPGTWTIERALQEARLDRLQADPTAAYTLQKQEGENVIHLAAGTYRLSQPIVVRPEDYNTRIVADGKVIISGGVQIKGWKKNGKYWVADFPTFNGNKITFRQLWVNGRKADRARDVQDFEKMFRIRSMDKPNGILYVPAAAVKKLVNGKGYQTSLPKGGLEGGLEMTLHEMWCVANLRIKSIKVQGDSAAVTFHDPESHIHFMHPWPSPMVTPNGEHNSAFYLTGSKAFLDTPGEWFADDSKVYYIPREGENMNTAEVEVPALETLLKVEGTPDEPVTNVTFEGITFNYSTWLRPSTHGHAPLQAGMYMIEAYKIRPQIQRPNGDHKLDNQGWVGRPSACVLVNSAENVNFEQCTFEHCAATALDYHQFIKGGKINRCTIRDVGGNGIVAGSFGPESYEAHRPYNPMDRREICTGLTITNNLITDVTNEDWGTIGIAAGYVRDICIDHNEISEVSYTGVSMGWGWNQQPCAMANNKITNNLIYHYARHMYDTAGIYTLGSQPHSLIEGNVVRDIYTPGYAHDPNHWFYPYTDEGSSGIMVKNNWTPAEKFLKNSNGPGNTWENNGPMVNDSIKANAGIISK